MLHSILKTAWILSLFHLAGCNHLSPSPKAQTGSVIFFHPDGMSLSHWDIGRMITVGPDKLSPYDKLPAMAVYKGHLKNNLVASSNAGATIHAYGVKVGKKSFGTDEGKSLKQLSILKEAQKRGLKTGLCQSGVLVEPGTAVFASSVEKRTRFLQITEQLIDSDVDILLGGGEKYLLPQGMKGHFGIGVRTDKKNLILKARQKGYHIIYTLKELKNIPPSAKKVLGLFAYENTYNDKTEEELKKSGLEPYNKSAPSIAQMAKYSLRFLNRDKSKNFLLVVEEEGTDNFSNKNNAEALFIAIKRSLKAISVMRGFVKKNKNTLLIVASDSNAGSPALVDHSKSKTLFRLNQKIPDTSDNQAPVDRKSTGYPFVSAPDRKGLKMPFAIVWPTQRDTGAGLVVKGEGLNSDQIKAVLDNTDIYKIMRTSLFGSKAPALKK